MKHKSLLMMMLLFAVFGVAKAQVTIGDLETATNDTYLPMNSLYEYSFSEQIYTAEEIGTAGTISSITMWLYGNADLYEMPFNIYMVETDKEVFDSNTDWVAVTDGDLVYTGSVTVHNTEAEAYTFELSTPFAYTGTGNLVICFQNNTGSWKGGLNGKVFGATDDPNRSIYARRDGTPYDLGDLGTAYAITPKRNVIEIEITPTGGVACEKVDTFEATAGTFDASLTWTGGSGHYNLEYKKSGQTEWTSLLSNSTAQNYTLTGLEDNSTYQARIQSICSDAVSGWKTVGFTTSEYVPEGLTVIGTGDVNNSYLPVNMYYYNSLTQQIYTVEELGSDAAAIERIDFYCSSLANYQRHFDIYMVSTTKSSFDNTTDWITVTNADLVYSGDVTIAAGWNIFVLDNPFIYDGLSNMALIVDATASSYQNGLNFRSYNADNQAIRIYSDGVNYDPFNPSSYTGTLETSKNQIRILKGAAPTCLKPLALTVNEVGPRNAELSWLSNANAWQICLNGNESNLINAQTNPFTLTGLAPETEYTVKVRANCGAADGVSDWSNEVTFTTLEACPAPVIESVVPDTHSAVVTWNGFSNQYNLRYRESSIDYAFITLTTDDVWQDGSGYQMLLDADANTYGTIIPETGPLTSSGDADASVYAEFEYKIPVNADGSLTTTNMVNNSSVTIQIPAGTYDWAITNPTPGDRMWIASAGGSIGGRYDDYVFEAGKIYEFHVYNGGENDATDLTITNIGKNTPRDNEWITLNNVTSPKTLTGLTPSTFYEVQVQGVCGGQDGSSAWTESTYFRTIDLCLIPTAFTCTGTTDNSATFAWESDASQWQIVYSTDSDFDPDQATPVNATTNPYTLQGLTAATTYYAYIRANCGSDGYSSWSSKVSFVTNLCSDADMCQLTFVITDSWGDGWNGAYIEVVDVETGLVLGQIANENLDGTTGSGQNEENTVYLAVCDGREIQFNWHVGSYDNEASYEVYDFEGELIFEGSGAMASPVTYEVSCVPPTCPKPVNLTVDDVQTHEATLSWTVKGEESMWRIAYSTNSNFDPDQPDFFMDVRSNPATINENLDADQTYFAYVRATCDEEDVSAWSNMVSFTTLEACPKPTNLTITDLMPTSAVVNWSSNNEIEFEYALVPSSDKSDRGSWLYYDNGTYSSSIGTGGSDVYWAVMFPADMLNEDMLTKVSMYEASDANSAEPITIYVYSGGENAPETLLYEETVETEQLNAFHEVTLTQPVIFDASQNLWIVLKEYGSYPAMGCNNTGDPNGRWISLNGTEWEDVTTYDLDYTWMIRGYFETSINPDDLEWISAPDATTSPYTLTELDPETTYAVRIRANCGADGYSNWAMAMFTTPSACETPSHLTVEPNATEATLSWTGYQSAYNIEYWIPAHVDVTPFEQQGSDVTATAVLTQYTYDLSDFAGLATIAIRHYNISDMFRLNVDDITVTNAYGETVLFADFEDGVIPSDWMNYDADGDGNVWGIWNITQTDGSGNPVGNGSYCLTSASYASGVLYPDNWLIIPNVQMGGTLTFVARGQDPSYAAEVFGVYVATEHVYIPASEPEFIEAVTDNPYVLDNLTPNTPYEVHVQGICTKTELTDWTNTVSFTTLSNCAVPTIDDITDVTANSATVEWTGAQDSYNLQYYIPGGFNEDVFTQVGEDETATEELTEYTFDLSQFSGTGSVAIRHYNITDMFRLLVDDIVLTDAGGNEIFNVDFEGDIPSNLMIVDHDGDGYNWGYLDYTDQTDYEPGTYFNGYAGLYSESFNNDYGPLYPDNWLIIDGVELGGTLTFVARGQDPSYAEEIFGVFVTTEEYISDDSEPVLVEGVTSPYTITDLDPSTIYAVQVQGLCEEDELTNWSQEAYFMTESACPAPSDLAFTDITDNSAVVSWTENGDATAWQLEVINYSATGSYAIGTGDIINVTTNPYTLTGLDDNSLYVVYVYAVCGPNEVSAASNWEYFQTLEGAGEEEQTVTLSSGWGWFSSYVEYPENALELIENSIAATSTTASIKSQNDGYVNLENGAWSGTLATMNNANMYLILTDGGELSLTAPLADPNDHPITLATGWNWIGYISDAEMSADYALSTITPSEGDMIKGQNGFTSFEGGAWSTALTLTPGAGYLYLNNGETENTLIYPAPAKGYVAEIPAITHWNTNHYLFPTNLTMMVTLNAEQFAMSEGSHEIGAFVNGECRGTALLQKSMGNYVAFLTVSGEPGEEVSFRLFDVNGNTEFAGIADEQIVYQSDDIYGSAKNPMVLNFRNTGVNEYGEISLFPNPTSGKVMIQGQAIETVKVYNAMGQLLINEEVGNADQVELNLSSLSAGVYTINVTMTNGQQGNQMVVKE